MERQNPETEQPHAASAVQNEAAALAAVGAKLREARERAGMSIDDVANRLKFAPRQIEALEEGNLAQLPERAFIRGFIRSYAKLVHLDDKPLLAALPGAPAPAPAPSGTAGHKPPPAPAVFSALEAHKTNLIWIGAAVVLVVIIIAIWPSGGRKPEPGLETNRGMPPAASAVAGAASAPASVTAPAAPAPTPVPAPRAHEPERHVVPAPAPAKKPRKPAEAAAVQSASGVPAAAQSPAEAASGVAATVKPRAAAVLRLVCDEDSWVEVKDETGAVLLSQLCLAGSEQRVTSAQPLSIVVGNAKGVKVYYRGRQIDLAPHTHADAARLKLR